MTRSFYLLPLSCLLIFQLGCQKEMNTEDFISDHQEYSEETADAPGTAIDDVEDHIHNDIDANPLQSLGCIKASSRQVAVVDDGNEKKSEFLSVCLQQTRNSPWCHQLVRPNPKSVRTFSCTYGSDQVHQLINPDETTWKYPIQGVKILQELEQKNIQVCQIYNWWRPEPYNKNVGGAKGRHPFGTSIDVKFCSRSDADQAFKELCKMRRAKKLRAIGDYGSSSLHLGIGDANDNTWGKRCP